MQKILSNKIRCKRCGDIIESSGVHDFVTCSCGNVSVDGGLDYLKRSYDPEGPGFEELSVCEGQKEDEGKLEMKDEYN